MGEPSRDELRAKLRAKMRERRDGRGGGGNHHHKTAPPSAAAESAVLGAFGDNAQLLQLAQDVLRDPRAAQRMLRATAEAAVPAPLVEEEEEEEEGLPPLATEHSVSREK